MNFNHSVPKSFQVPAHVVGKSAVELVANASVVLPTVVNLKPAQSVVMYMDY